MKIYKKVIFFSNYCPLEIFTLKNCNQGNSKDIIARSFKLRGGWVAGGLAQWLASRTTDQGVPGSRPDRVAVRCGLEQVIFTPSLVLVKPRKPWTHN